MGLSSATNAMRCGRLADAIDGMKIDLLKMLSWLLRIEASLIMLRESSPNCEMREIAVMIVSTEKRSISGGARNVTGCRMSMSGNAQIVICEYAVGVDSVSILDKGHRQGL